MRVPIQYSAILLAYDGHESSVDLEEPGWLDRDDVESARSFTLQPKPGSALPVVCVDLSTLPDGTPRKLVYFSRVCGQLSTSGEANEDTALFRLYCVGWQAYVAGRTVASKSWIYPALDPIKYPGGSIVVADEPPFVNELIAHFAALRQIEVGALAAES